MGTCILCGLESNFLNTDGRDVLLYDCNRCGRVEITGTLAHDFNSYDEFVTNKHILSGITRYRTKYKLPTETFFSTNIIQQLDSSFIPRNISQKIDLILKYFETKSDYFGQPFDINIENDYPIGFCVNNMEFFHLLGLLIKQELIGSTDPGKVYHLSFKGWNRLDELRKTITKKRQAFIAMWFDETMSDVYENGFQRAVKDCKYEPMRIDFKEHLNKIDDEIIAEIRNSGFMIADFTGNRGGVYYEAGFAHGLGIPVIWTCRENDLKELHFDTRQYNHISWKTSDELYTKLVNRIKATITI